MVLRVDSLLLVSVVVREGPMGRYHDDDCDCQDGPDVSPDRQGSPPLHFGDEVARGEAKDHLEC